MDFPEEPRSAQQNKALHKYFELVADELNGAGYSVQMMLKKDVALDWSPALVKEILWRSVQKAILKKESTTELTKRKEIDLIYDHLNRYLSEKFSIHIPFPHDHKDV